MKKQILALIACLMLVMSTTAQAVTLRVPVASPSLSFSGTTARGSAICQADGNNDRINAKLISHIECGRTTVSLPLLISIAQALSVDL